jgi:hypothetical protein
LRGFGGTFYKKYPQGNKQINRNLSIIKGTKPMGWIRVKECDLCGKDRCLQNTENSKMFYCFRLGKVYFRREDGGINAGENRNRRAKKSVPGQKTLDFWDDFQNHLGAIST